MPTHRTLGFLRRAARGWAGLLLSATTAWAGGEPFNPPPTIVTQPQSQTAVAGSTVTFHVGAVGQGTIIYQWLFNSTINVGTDSPNLTLPNVQTTHAGGYSVRVSNAGGGRVSSSATLTVLAPPTITVQPQSQTVPVGSPAVFTVTAEGTPPLEFQWRFSGVDLPGETARFLIISNAQPANAGRYQVKVSNEAGFVTSGQAVLSLTTTTGFILVPLGGTGILQTNNFNSSSPLERICDVPVSAPVWIGLKPVEDGGEFVLDTIGSAIDTVLAVYSRSDTGEINLITCDSNSAPDGQRSWLRFPAVGNVEYLVRIDGATNARGPLQFNWKLGVPPQILTEPVPHTAVEGETATFSVAAFGLPEPTYQWFFNGQVLPHETNATLTLAGVTMSSAGSYRVGVENFVGSAMSADAPLTVFPPLRFQTAEFRTNGFHLSLAGPPGRYWIEASPDFKIWESLVLLDAPSGAAEFTDPASTRQDQRFYRATRF